MCLGRNESNWMGTANIIIVMPRTELFWRSQLAGRAKYNASRILQKPCRVSVCCLVIKYRPRICFELNVCQKSFGNLSSSVELVATRHVRSCDGWQDGKWEFWLFQYFSREILILIFFVTVDFSPRFLGQNGTKQRCLHFSWHVCKKVISTQVKYVGLFKKLRGHILALFISLWNSATWFQMKLIQTCFCDRIP